jgi:tRNA(Ile)-lysidine synthase
MDSTALLHLLRFTPGLPSLALNVIHVDHGLRGTSARDAEWVAGLCRAWDLPLSVVRAEGLRASEEVARDARYAALALARQSAGAQWVALGHHADDQAETVLQRAVRGAGLQGISGMAAFRKPGIWRPLLTFWRAELLEYARAVGLTWLDDESNQDARFTRNAIRLTILPALEALVAPGARGALVRLADLAREAEDGWAQALPLLMSQLAVQEGSGETTLDADAFMALPTLVQIRVTRAVCDGLGFPLDKTGTQLAAEFISGAKSGRGVALTGGVRLRRDLARFAFCAPAVVEGDVAVSIPGGQAGSGIARLGGRFLRVEWKDGGANQNGVGFTVVGPRFPLTVRASQPGDRIELPYGTKKLKKLYLESRVPEPKRGRLPVLVDAKGRVLWIPGIAEAVADASSTGGESLEIKVDDAVTD